MSEFPAIKSFLTFIPKQQIALQPGSKSYGYWISPPQPMFLDIYLFNWTNAQDFTNKSIKPNFVEVGPFRFQEIPRKVNVTFHSSNSTVSYRKQSRYFFVADQSKGKLDDIITSVNVIALVSFLINRLIHAPLTFVHSRASFAIAKAK